MCGVRDVSECESLIYTIISSIQQSCPLFNPISLFRRRALSTRHAAQGGTCTHRRRRRGWRAPDCGERGPGAASSDALGSFPPPSTPWAALSSCTRSRHRSEPRTETHTPTRPLPTCPRPLAHRSAPATACTPHTTHATRLVTTHHRSRWTIAQTRRSRIDTRCVTALVRMHIHMTHDTGTPYPGHTLRNLHTRRRARGGLA